MQNQPVQLELITWNEYQTIWKAGNLILIEDNVTGEIVSEKETEQLASIGK